MRRKHQSAKSDHNQSPHPQRNHQNAESWQTKPTNQEIKVSLEHKTPTYHPNQKVQPKSQKQAFTLTSAIKPQTANHQTHKTKTILHQPKEPRMKGNHQSSANRNPKYPNSPESTYDPHNTIKPHTTQTTNYQNKITSEKHQRNLNKTQSKAQTNNQYNKPNQQSSK